VHLSATSSLKSTKSGCSRRDTKAYSLFYEDWRALEKRQKLDLKLFRIALVAAFALAYAFLQTVTWICL